METVVYRKIEENIWAKTLYANDSTNGWQPSSVPASAREAQPLSPGLFYPLVTAPELVTWMHWLPTTVVFHRTQAQTHPQVLSTLRQLNAPPEVLEEFHWSWKMDLFEAYEVRTPVRRDARDPLLLGRLGEQRYRMALWGESLLPQEEITALVHQSLALRARTARWQAGLALSGALLGLAIGLWLGHHSAATPHSAAQPPIMTGLVLAFLGFCFGGLPMLLYTPKNRQHDFLDHYRS